MGSVKRPCCSSQWSLSCSSSRTVWAAKKSRVTLCLVSSQVTALAPFSQNSNELVCRESGHAQPGQSKPPGWFIDSSALVPHLDVLFAQRSGSSVQRTPAAGRRIIRREHWLADRLLLRFGRNGGTRLIAHNRTFVWFADANADFDQIDLVSLRGPPSGGPRHDDISWWATSIDLRSS